jgi:hypothetical protein
MAKNTFAIAPTAVTQWPSGTHEPDCMIRDGALVISIDFMGMTDEALAALVKRAQDCLDYRARQKAGV